MDGNADQRKLIAAGRANLAFHIGPELTWPLHRDGTIGQDTKIGSARTAMLNATIESKIGGNALGFVNKAVVKQASRRFPWCRSIEFAANVMKKEKSGRRPAEQMRRMFTDFLCSAQPELDESRRLASGRPEMRGGVASEGPRSGASEQGIFAQSFRFRWFSKEFRGLSALK